MKIGRKIDILIVLVLLAVVGLYVGWMLWKAIPMGDNYNASVIKNGLLYFVEYNGGQFPASQQELFDTNYMEIQKSMIHLKFPDSYRYAEGNTKPTWQPCARFKSFQIRYGVKLEELALVNGALIDQRTRDKVFLLNGPCGFYVPYMDYSVELYQKMAAMSQIERQAAQ